MSKTTAMLRIEKEIGVELRCYLIQEYHQNKKAVGVIADEIGVKRSTLLSWFIRLDIPRRNQSEAAEVRYVGTTVEYRKSLTRNANKTVDEIISKGEFWLRGKFGEENNAKNPEARRKISEFKKRNNPMHIEEYAMKMRKSMEQVLRDRATPQELRFKQGIESREYFPKFQHAEYKAVIDFAFISKKLGIEIDGEPHYLNQFQKEKDRLRDQGLEERGWTIVRYTNDQIESDLDGVLEEVIELVDASERREAYMC